MIETVHEERAVWQAGQRVVDGVMNQALFGARARRDIAKAPHPANRNAVQSLRNRVALEDLAVGELKNVEALGVRCGVELAHLIE